MALASLRANMTVVGLMAAPKIQLKSVRSMQRNTPGLLDRRIGPKDMFIVVWVLVLTLLSGYHYTPWGVIPKQAYEHPKPLELQCGALVCTKCLQEWIAV
ncbi:hypothetical protein EMCRGX_G029545 [Ephydatia muelleri]